jgi:2-polyprenyl-3-methyl-5-hydroxy-6-metoxy-1,4-benzoquinol methylase
MNEETDDWRREVESGERFKFGGNWTSFLRLLNEDRICSAEDSLKDMLGVDRLDGVRFLDAGSGSGLFSLAARRLGANVVSFDYDLQSVACTAELKHRYFREDSHWQIKHGSVLDHQLLNGLGRFDYVYSWGVLHHTGAMWDALEAVAPLVAPGGRLFISIYNDQGRTSRMWTRIKRAYVRSPRPLKGVILALALVRVWGPSAVRKLFSGELRSARRGRQSVLRGMDRWHDAKDWVGGYPFEVAKPEQIFDFYHARGFELQRMTTCGGGLGCNEYVFRRGAK